MAAPTCERCDEADAVSLSLVDGGDYEGQATAFYRLTCEGCEGGYSVWPLTECVDDSREGWKPRYNAKEKP